MRKGEVALLRRATFEPLFMTYPSEVGSTSPWTLLAAMMRGPLSHPICRQATTFCGVLSVIQSITSCTILSLQSHVNRCVISFHVCLSRQTALDTLSLPSMHRTSRSVALHGSSTMFTRSMAHHTCVKLDGSVSTDKSSNLTTACSHESSGISVELPALHSRCCERCHEAHSRSWSGLTTPPRSVPSATVFNFVKPFLATHMTCPHCPSCHVMFTFHVRALVTC